jgi:choline dehydrogenase-like flavoprotein
MQNHTDNDTDTDTEHKEPQMTTWTASDQQILAALAQVVTPGGDVLGEVGDGHALIPALEGVLGSMGLTVEGYLHALRALDWGGVALRGRRLSALPLSERIAALEKLTHSGVGAWTLRVVVAPLKAARTKDAALRRALGMKPDDALPGRAPEAGRWRSQMTDARDVPEGEALEADVVVVGSGAGGAAVAHRLASQGLAVLVLEEGGYFSRPDFDGDALSAQHRMFRNGGATVTLGNAVIPVLMGVTVGGSTTINSGTCYRVSDQTQRRWVLDEGLSDLGPGSLDPYYAKVEAMLQVQEAHPDVLGGCARVIARGSEALGLSHGPLMRNAPGCDGQGVCCFGCPTAAKRSADVSYWPAALAKGAHLLYHARADGLILDGDRACGVRARAVTADGSPGAAFTVRAKAVALACGTLHTPALLLRDRLANRSGHLGKGLTIHPASQSYGLFDEPIRGWEAIPQGYAIESFADEGLRFEGAFLPLSLTAASFSQWGAPWTKLVEHFDRLACFGFMIADRTRGRVVLGPNGQPQMLYWMTDHDRQRIIRGHALLAQVYFAAGAQAVYPGVHGPFSTLRSPADAQRLADDGPRLLRPHHLDLSAYHPLGTCRMGPNPMTSVTDTRHETHDVKHLFICDGAAVPGPLGVNPQMTIMAFAERSAAFIERRVTSSPTASHHPVSASSTAPPPRVEFFEEMRGEGLPVGALLASLHPDAAAQQGPAPTPAPIPIAFTVRAAWPVDPRRALRDGHLTLSLSGRLSIGGLVSPDTPCAGTLLLSPLRRHATLVYDLLATADDGIPLRIYGEKHTSLAHPLHGMTTLYTQVTRAADASPLLDATLYFDLSQLSTWLGTWRIAR